MKSRLKKNNVLIKTANYNGQIIESFNMKSGDVISFNIRVLANRPWYEIIHDYDYSNSSYYDGPDLDRAMEIYSELLLAFKGSARADEFIKKKSLIENNAKKLLIQNKSVLQEEMYNNLKSKPLFLGLNDF